MYSFINRSKPAEPLNISQKRQIRAHVSKSLARQRKLEDELLRESEKIWASQTYVDKLAVAGTQAAALDGESAWRRHKLKKRTASRAKSRTTAEPAGEANSPSARSGSTDTVHQSWSRCKYVSNSDSDGEQQRMPEFPTGDEEQGAPVENSVSRDHLSQLFKRKNKPEAMLTTWTANSLPMHGDLLVRVCAFQMTHFRPEVSIEQASDITGFVWEKSPCTILSYALSLSALGHLQSTTPSSGNDVVNMFKGKVFREMIKHLPSDERSDELVPSILCVTSFELSRASLEARTHLQALNTIRSLERHKADSKLPIMFEGLDLLHSIMFDLPTVSQMEQESMTSSNNVNILFTYLKEERDNDTTKSDTIPELFSYITEMLLHLEMLANGAINDHEVKSSESDLFFVHLEDFRAIYCTNDQQEEEEQFIARCFYHTCAILYNVLVNRRKIRNSSNKKHATGIYFATIGNRRFWHKYPRLKACFLTVALSASRDNGEKSLFQSRLAAIIYRFGVPGWEGIKAFLCSFLAVRSQLDSVARQTSSAKKTTKQGQSLPRTTSLESAPPSAILGSISPPAVAVPTPEHHRTYVAPANKPHPRFIPLPHKSLTASVIENARLYPDLNESYYFMPRIPIRQVMRTGYAHLCQNHNFDSILLKGDNGRMSFTGTTIPDVGWAALF